VHTLSLLMQAKQKTPGCVVENLSKKVPFRCAISASVLKEERERSTCPCNACSASVAVMRPWKYGREITSNTC
jgi:hypothetical protein